MSEKTSSWGWGIAAVAVVLCGLVPPMVLGAAIGWPASLGLPPAEQLALVLPHLDALRWGYGVYLAYSVAFFPMIAGALGLFPPRPGSRLAALALGFAALSTLCRSVGIVRWLVPAPLLAADGQNPVSVAVFGVMNAYGGAIGEVLGVGLFAGAALLCLALLWLRGGHRWWGGITLAVALVHAVSVVEALGWDLGAYVSVVAVSLLGWLLALGVMFLRNGSPSAGKSPGKGPRE